MTDLVIITDKYKNDKKSVKNRAINGKNFEIITDIENKLYENDYKKENFGKKNKYSYYLYKSIDDNNKITYLLQSGFKLYIKKMFNIEVFRCPDEAYIVKTDKKYIIKILEKKAQGVEGSVETKLWASPSLKREYELIIGDKFVIEYALCLNKYLEKKINSDNKKYKVLKQILDESKINIFYGESNDYFEKIYNWINN